MKILNFLILILILFTSCNKKNAESLIKVQQTENSISEEKPDSGIHGEIDSVHIKKILVGLLEGLPAGGNIDDNLRLIEIDSVNIDLTENSKFKNGILDLGVVSIDTVLKKMSHGKTVTQAPYGIGGFVFKKIIFRENGSPVAFYKKPFKITEQEISSYRLEQIIRSPLLNELLRQVSDLEGRIQTLLSEVEKLKEEEPDHAARELPPTLNSLLARVRSIDIYYQRKEKQLITEGIRVDLNALNNIKYSVERIEEEVEDPKNIPTFIENELIFNTGKFDVKSSNKLENVIADIKYKIDSVRTQYPMKPIEIILAISGYADEQDINSNLKKVLLDIYNENNNPKKESQAFLNKLLSQKRADNVFNYIENAINSTPYSNYISFVKSGAIGKGWEYPKGIKKSPVKNRKERRIVKISHLVYPMTKE